MARISLIAVHTACIACIFATSLFAAPRCGFSEKGLDAKLFLRERYCAECIEARRFLLGLGISFREFDADNPDVMRRLVDGEGQGALPAIHICGEWFFGFNTSVRASILERFAVPS